MNLKLAVVTLWAEDVNRTADFYRDVLGLPLLMIDRGRPHFDLGGAYLVILPGRPYKLEDPGQTRFPVLAFAVDDLDAVVHQLKSQGLEMPWGVEEDRDSHWVMFNDPGGNLLEIAQFGNRHRGK
jgi:catechol 2,3-dioxygenase-like lactoylglutathione lyase family enzyme